VGIAAAGVLLIVLGGWRLIPHRQGRRSAEDMFDIDQYLTEVRVPAESKLVGKRLNEIAALATSNAVIVGLINGAVRYPAPSRYMTLRAGDVLILKVDTDELEELAASAGLELVGSEELGQADLKSKDVALMEAVVLSNSVLAGQTAQSIDLRRRYGVNLLAVAREGAQLQARLDRITLHPGDVLLLQAHEDTLSDTLILLGCIPLAQRSLRVGKPRNMVLTVGIFAVALLLSAFGVVPVQVAFVGGAIALVLTSMLSVTEAYAAVDWPIIILLGAMIPVGEALEVTGGAALIANGLLQLSGQMPAVVTLGIVLVGTMTLSDVINNAAAVVLMAPIALKLAVGMGASADPFLMAVAIGASCAFLTPIGHQSNTLVMGPGGYKFGDYWRLGLPMEILVVAVGLPLILFFWPL
jgi:di/tricarboxylate transporter